MHACINQLGPLKAIMVHTRLRCEYSGRTCETDHMLEALSLERSLRIGMPPSMTQRIEFIILSALCQD